MEIKKTWEKLSPLIPPYQAFVLPMHKDKQLSQPTPLRIIDMVCHSQPMKGWLAYGYNTPSMDASLRNLLVHVQSYEV